MFAQGNKKVFLIMQLTIWILVAVIAFSFLGLLHHDGPPHKMIRPHHGPPPSFHIRNMLFLLSVIGIFYWNHRMLIPKFVYPKKYKQYFLWVVVSLLVLLLLFIGFTRPHHRFSPKTLHEAIILLTSLSLAFLLPLAYAWYTRIQEAEKEKKEAELSYLKSQINHHFLFNSLNNIYALSIQGSPEVSGAVYSLSSIMRHMVSETGEKRILLSREIEFIHHYLSIQRLRLSDNTKLQVNIDGNPDTKMIAPMLLMPIIENCFKHGVSTSQPSEIDINLQITDQQVILDTRNTLIEGLHTEGIASGVGLDNVRKRLVFEYDQHFDLKQSKENGFYRSHLNITLS